MAPGSLSWVGGRLIDWVHGGDAWGADGGFVQSGRGWGNGRFDAAVVDRTGEWAVVFERRGTVGLLLRRGEIVREVHRSSYRADVYDYPVCLFPGPDRRVLLAHCPDAYNVLVIEDAATGERLTERPAASADDVYHSRLAASPSGARLLSAGWVWQPWDVVGWWEVRVALACPAVLDVLHAPGLEHDVSLAEASSAAWIDDDTLVVGSSAESEDADEALAREGGGARLPSAGFAVVDAARGVVTQAHALGHPPGRMMPVGRRWIVTFFDHPRLICLRTGAVIRAWPDIATGRRVSSLDPPTDPQMALDPAGGRFAVASGEGIEVVQLDRALVCE